MSERTSLGVGVWVTIAGLIVAVLAGLARIVVPDMAFVVIRDGQTLLLFITLAFFAGAGLAVVGMVTAVAERTIDYVRSSEGA